MQTAVSLTLAEAAMVLDPPVSERQLRAIITALGWQPCAQRRTGRRGFPALAYPADELMRLHAAIAPFMYHAELPRKRAPTGIMAVMEMTLPELAEILDPSMTAKQIRTLIWLAGIEPSGRRHTGRAGHPFSTYHDDAIRRAHAQEAARTAKQFTDNDWIASALLDRALIGADTETGELHWPDGTRAEYLNHDNYGYVKTPPDRVAAHRIIWIAAEGEIPPGLQVNHRNRLRWDNRRANLELVTFSHNVRHGAGTPYLTYHQAVTQLAMVPAPLPEVPCTDRMTRAGGVFQK